MKKYKWLILFTIPIAYMLMILSCSRGFDPLELIDPDSEPVYPVTPTPPEMMPPEMMPTDEGIGIFDTNVLPGHGLVAEAFLPGTQIVKLPDFDAFEPFHTWMVANIDVPHTPYLQGFPELGVDVLEWFAIRLRGQLKVETSGIYNFTVWSDDGARIFINGNMVIDNDGLHAFTRKDGSAMLEAGYHDLEIQYFQGPRTHIGLQWLWQPPGGESVIVPPEVLFPPRTMETTPKPEMPEMVEMPEEPEMETDEYSSDPSLILYLSFDKVNGNEVSDHSQYMNNAQLIGNPQLVDGKFGQAIEFDGETNFVEVPHDNSLSVSDAVTVMAWIRTSRYYDPGSNWQGILAKGDQHPRSYSFYTERGGKIHLGLANSGAKKIIEIEGHNIIHDADNVPSDGIFELDVWQHVAARIADGERQYWINGQKAGTQMVVTPFPGLDDTESVVIGKTHEIHRNFLGVIDEVRIWNRALSDEEIIDHMNKGISSN